VSSAVAGGRPGRVPRFIWGESPSPYTVHLCLGVRDPGIAALRSNDTSRVVDVKPLFCFFFLSYEKARERKDNYLIRHHDTEVLLYATGALSTRSPTA
jgi:hypothetical protein